MSNTMSKNRKSAQSREPTLGLMSVLVVRERCPLAF
jgi:hypothetical protein